MKRVAAGILSIFFLTALVVAADEVKTAKVLSVKTYERGRIAYWEGRAPIYDDYPFYDITLSLDDKKYIVRYESGTGYYPSSWKAGNEIKVRLRGKGKIYLLNGSEEVPAAIMNARTQDCVFPGSPP